MIGVVSLALAAHRQWGVTGETAACAAQEMFRASDFGVYQLCRWREGDASLPE